MNLLIENYVDYKKLRIPGSVQLFFCSLINYQSYNITKHSPPIRYFIINYDKKVPQNSTFSSQTLGRRLRFNFKRIYQSIQLGMKLQDGRLAISKAVLLYNEHM